MGPGASFSAAMKPSTETAAFMTTLPMGSSFASECQVLWGASSRSCTKSIGWQRPSVPCVAGMVAQEFPPDFDIPGWREPGELPELAHEMGLVEVPRVSGNASPGDGRSDVERQHGGGEAVVASQPLRRDTDDGPEPLRQVGAAGANCHADVADRHCPAGRRDGAAGSADEVQTVDHAQPPLQFVLE